MRKSIPSQTHLTCDVPHSSGLFCMLCFCLFELCLHRFFMGRCCCWCFFLKSSQWLWCAAYNLSPASQFIPEKKTSICCAQQISIIFASASIHFCPFSLSLSLFASLEVHSERSSISTIERGMPIIKENTHHKVSNNNLFKPIWFENTINKCWPLPYRQTVMHK